jgi:hypothetical protein
MIRLINLLKEDDFVKNKKTGNVYMVKKMNPSKHTTPSTAEIEKIKAANNGKIPKGKKTNIDFSKSNKSKFKYTKDEDYDFYPQSDSDISDSNVKNLFNTLSKLSSNTKYPIAIDDKEKVIKISRRLGKNKKQIDIINKLIGGNFDLEAPKRKENKKDKVKWNGYTVRFGDGDRNTRKSIDILRDKKKKKKKNEPIGFFSKRALAYSLGLPGGYFERD